MEISTVNPQIDYMDISTVNPQIDNMDISTVNHHSRTISDVDTSDLNNVTLETFDARKAIDNIAAPFLANLPTFVHNLRLLQKVFLQFKRAGKIGAVADISQEEIGHLNLTLYKIVSVEMSPDVQSQFNAKNVLEQIKNPQNYFPDQYQRIAIALLDEFEATNWNRPQSRSTSPSPSPSPLPTPAINRVNGHSNGSERVFHPDPDDPVWNGGIMHHVIKKIKPHVFGQRKPAPTFKIDPSYVTKNANVFGHNGLNIGDCWPYMLIAFRDGAHGATQAGIYGTSTAGCYSIIVSGGYTDINKDRGDIIWYADPTAKKTEIETIENNKGRQALERSCVTRNPVRVIRSHETGWSGRPFAGYRYDGLYRITSVKQKRRANGQGMFKIFCFKRLENQAEIALDRPTKEEQRIFARVGDEF